MNVTKNINCKQYLSIKPSIFQEICDNPEFIIEGTSRFDLIQGELGKTEGQNG